MDCPLCHIDHVECVHAGDLLIESIETPTERPTLRVFVRRTPQMIPAKGVTKADRRAWEREGKALADRAATLRRAS